MANLKTKSLPKGMKFKKGGNVPEESSSRVKDYARTFYDLQRKKDFKGLTDREHARYFVDNPEFKSMLPDITNEYNNLYPKARYSFQHSVSEDGSSSTGFRERPPVDPPQRSAPPANTARWYPSPTSPEYATPQDRRGMSRPTPRKPKPGQRFNQGGVVDRLKGSTELQSGLLGMAGETSDAIFDRAIEEKLARHDPRMDPRDVLKKTQRMGVAKDLLGSTTKGAAMGAVAGPVGMAVGAGVGLLAAGVKSLAGRKANKRAINEAGQEYDDTNATAYNHAIASNSYKEGGKVKGKGGPKDDKVQMKAPPGSFIVPAEKAKEAMKLGKEFLGWDGDEKAPKSKGTRINASNGEVMFTPEEVEELDFYGVDLNKLAPNAEPQNRASFRTGGEVEDEEPGDKSDYYGDVSKVEPEAPAVPNTVKEPKPFKAYGETLGALQGTAGLYGLASAKKLPDPVVSNELKMLAYETRKLSEQGMDPSTRNYATKNIERSRRAGMNDVTSRGGTAAEVAAGMTAMTSGAMDSHEKIALADEEIRRSNKSPYFDALRLISGRKDEIWREKKDIKEKKDEMYAGLLHAGVSNIVGARKYKEHLDYLKENKASINFNLPQ
jgi:hypothetical protein